MNKLHIEIDLPDEISAHSILMALGALTGVRVLRMRWMDADAMPGATEATLGTSTVAK